MVRDTWRIRVPAQAFACATLAGALAGCGGGGGGTSTSGGGAGASSTESPWLQAEFVAVDSNHQFVRVWDPAAPGVAVQSVPLVQSNGIAWTSSHLVFSDATRYDASTRQVTVLGHAKVFYDNDGKLYAIDLRGGQPHAPVQLSSATDVFLPRSAVAMDAAGDDAWVDAQGGTHDWAIRSTMDAAGAPVPVLRILAPLRDAATGLPQYLFASLGGQSGTAVQPTTFEVVDTTFAAIPVAAVGAMTGSTFDGWVGADPAQPGLGYLRIANQLRALRWAAGGVSVDAAAITSVGATLAPVSAVADAQSLYVSSGTALLAVSNAGVRGVGTFSAAPGAIVDAGAYVAAVEPITVTTTQTSSQVETLRKSDGLLTLVEDASPDVQLLGAGDAGLVLAGTPEQGPAFVVASGDNATRTTVGAQAVGLVRAASALADQPGAPVALVSCAASGGSGFCGAGAVLQTPLGGGGATTLGLLATTTPAWLRGDAVAGLAGVLSGQSFLPSPTGFGRGQTDVRDAWQFVPGTAGSLARVTANLP